MAKKPEFYCHEQMGTPLCTDKELRQAAMSPIKMGEKYYAMGPMGEARHMEITRVMLLGSFDCEDANGMIGWGSHDPERGWVILGYGDKRGLAKADFS